MKQIEFRFYEELNDFLPKTKQKKTFIAEFPENFKVIDALEKIGVPHTEVDLIIVNGESVDFNYYPKNFDRVAVYPVFESIDIAPINHLRPEPLREPKFILDVHLGRLAKYMRMCGFDCIYENLDDAKIIARALAENRTILTKDKGLLKTREVTHGYWVRAKYPKEQFTEVIRRFDLATKINFLTRCLLCNNLIETIQEEKVKHLVPRNTADFYHTFYICKSCNKIYWEGSHYSHMLQLITALIQTSSDRK